jgi:hypothetical protein
VEEYTGGNRAAYLIAMENAADASRHSRLTGRAPAGAKLTLSKEFVTETSPVEPLQTDVLEGVPSPAGEKQTFVDRLRTELTVPASGSFTWAINPSTRPAAMERRMPTVSETPSRTATWANQTQTQPNQVAGEGAEGTYEDIALDVREADAARVLRLTLTGQVPADDYDLELYRRVGPDLVPAGSSGNPANPEEILLDDPPVGEYVLRVVNFLAAGPWTVEGAWLPAGPDRVEPGTVEAWTLTCERPDGVTVARKVVIARGEAATVAPCRT